MGLAPTLSALHVLALGIGLGSLFMRGRFLRALRAGPDPRPLGGLFAADNLWGIAAALWLVTGLAHRLGNPACVITADDPVYLAQFAGLLSSPDWTAGSPSAPVSVAPPMMLLMARAAT